MIFTFSLSDFTLYDRLWLHPHHYRWPNFLLFYGWITFHCASVPHLLYLFICQWMFSFLPYLYKRGKNKQWIYDGFTFLQYAFVFFLLNENFMFYVKPQHGSAIGIHIPHLFWTSLPSPPHPTHLGWYRDPVWVSWAIQQIPVGCLFYTWSCKFLFHVTLSTHLTLSSPLPMSICLFSTSVSPLLPCK